MSNHNLNNDQQKLKQFLDAQKNAEATPPDEFEREALEGFAMLDNEQELLDLKRDLDKKMYTEVFTEEKKPSARYWYAAAALVAVIGFSVYLLQNSSLSQKKDLAIARETKVLNPPQERLPQQELLNSQQETAAQEKMQEASSEKKSPDLRAKGAAVTPLPAPPGLLKDMNFSSNASHVSAAEKPASAPASAEELDSVAPLEKKSTDAGRLEEEKSMDLEVAKQTPFTTLYSEQQEIAPSSDAKRKQPAKKEVTNTTRADEYMVSGGVTASTRQIYYTGGDAALHADIKQALEKIQAVQKFDATLLIGSNKKVEKVIFKNTFTLDKKQVESVKEILLKLNKFDFQSQPAASIEYPVVFRP